MPSVSTSKMSDNEGRETFSSLLSMTVFLEVSFESSQFNDKRFVLFPSPFQYTFRMEEGTALIDRNG